MQLIYLIIALAVCISIHEASHAWVAWKLGDPTAKIEGRVTLNPLKHLDPLGTVMIFIASIGWGKPTPFNEDNLKHPKRDTALISIAGPLSNLFTAFLIIVLLKYVNVSGFPLGALMWIRDLSIVLFWFNLLPIAPLDGSKIVGIFIPPSKEAWYQNFLTQGPMYLIFLIIGDFLIAETTGFSLFSNYLNFTRELTIIGISLIS